MEKWFDKIVTGGFISPAPNLGGGNADLVKDEIYKAVGEGGFDFLVCTSFGPDNYPQAFEAQLNYAQKYGFRIVVTEENLYARTPVDLAELEQSSKAYTAHPAFGGLLIADEPSTDAFAKVAELKKECVKRFPLSLAFINLFPSWTPKKLLNKEENVDYETYVNTYLSAVNPQVLSYDFYPFVGEFPDIHKEYFHNLSFMANIAKERGIPLWTFVQATSYAPHVRYVTEAEMNWQIRTALAFGCRGFTYFTYTVPVGAVPQGEAYESAVLNRDGTPSPRYGYAKSCNKHLREADNALRGLTWRGVKFSEPREFAEVTLPVAVSGSHLLTGLFESDTHVALYIVNNSITRKSEVTAECGDCEVLGGEIITKNQKVVIGLDAGRSVIIKIRK